MVSLRADPTRVTPVGLVLYIVQPLLPPAEAKLTLYPFALINGRPLLIVELVAVKLPYAVAHTIAPEETFRISAPLPRSVMVLVPEVILNVSAPAPPVSVLVPALISD